MGAHLRNGPLTGLALVQHLRTQGLHTRSVILLDQAEKNLVVDAFRAGAKGLFSRIVVVPYAMSDANSNNSGGKGAVVRLRNGTFTTIAEGLTLPTGMTLGSDGVLYVSNFGDGPPGAGQIVKITLP